MVKIDGGRVWSAATTASSDSYRIILKLYGVLLRCVNCKKVRFCMILIKISLNWLLSTLVYFSTTFSMGPGHFERFCDGKLFNNTIKEEK